MPSGQLTRPTLASGDERNVEHAEEEGEEDEDEDEDEDEAWVVGCSSVQRRQCSVVSAASSAQRRRRRRIPSGWARVSEAAPRTGGRQTATAWDVEPTALQEVRRRWNVVSSGAAGLGWCGFEPRGRQRLRLACVHRGRRGETAVELGLERASDGLETASDGLETASDILYVRYWASRRRPVRRAACSSV
ncbi:hypothetical protein RJ55_03506 [Drechmeria coniospora]|nr:hypothetical protein RJ55_03506 [Drechmeria coniospora]